MSSRARHNVEYTQIAKAIQDYKTSHKTQKECAKDANIPYKVFSYYCKPLSVSS